jgi:hypothetical protein
MDRKTLEEAIILLKKSEGSKKILKRDMKYIIASLSKSVGYKCIVTKALPSGHIYVGVGKENETTFKIN